jgi:hypothetical protein
MGLDDAFSDATYNTYRYIYSGRYDDMDPSLLTRIIKCASEMEHIANILTGADEHASFIRVEAKTDEEIFIASYASRKLTSQLYDAARVAERDTINGCPICEATRVSLIGYKCGHMVCYDCASKLCQVCANNAKRETY